MLNNSGVAAVRQEATLHHPTLEIYQFCQTEANLQTHIKRLGTFANSGLVLRYSGLSQLLNEDKTFNPGPQTPQDDSWDTKTQLSLKLLKTWTGFVSLDASLQDQGDPVHPSGYFEINLKSSWHLCNRLCPSFCSCCHTISGIFPCRLREAFLLFGVCRSGVGCALLFWIQPQDISGGLRFF